MAFGADQIVCTASIGVLNANIINFNPPLPEWKTKSFQQYTMATFGKIFVEFDTKFWKNVKHIYIAND